MKYMTYKIGIIFILVSLYASCAYAARLPIELIKLPPGFQIEVYAQGLVHARSMTRSPQGTIYVGTRNSDVVYALTEKDQDGKVDQIYIVDDKLWMPIESNGIAHTTCKNFQSASI